MTDHTLQRLIESKQNDILVKSSQIRNNDDSWEMCSSLEKDRVAFKSVSCDIILVYFFHSITKWLILC